MRWTFLSISIHAAITAIPKDERGEGTYRENDQARLSEIICGIF